MISKKIYNDEYAQCIATYGINGENGEQGANGILLLTFIIIPVTVWKCLFKK